MSWGGQPPQQYGGYGQGQPGGYGPPGGQPGGYRPPGGQPGGYQPPGGQPGGYQPPGGQPGGYQPPGGQPGGYQPPGGQPGGYQPPGGQPGGYRAPGAPAPGQMYGQPQQGYGGPAAPPGQQLYGQYGSPGGPPQGQYGGAPGYGQQAPPPPGVSPEVWGWFQSVDSDRNGKITSEELRLALHNGNWSPFNAETCRLMVGMFDKDRSGTIDVNEFQALWKYVQDWKSCFDRFDTDRSGNIDSRELSNAFRTFGYNLSPQFCDLVVRVFDRRAARNIQFDDFIQACVLLKTLTDKFRAKDHQQNGTVRISYEEFLDMALDVKV